MTVAAWSVSIRRRRRRYANAAANNLISPFLTSLKSTAVYGHNLGIHCWKYLGHWHSSRDHDFCNKIAKIKDKFMIDLQWEYGHIIHFGFFVSINISILKISQNPIVQQFPWVKKLITALTRCSLTSLRDWHLAFCVSRTCLDHTITSNYDDFFLFFFG